MLSFTVCWVIPREWRGWKTSRFRPLAEETTHIYNFLSSLQAQSSNMGDRQLVSWSPSLCRLLLNASAQLWTQGEWAPTASAAGSGAHSIPGASAVTNPPRGKARVSSDRSALSSSNPLSRCPWPSPGAGGHLRSNKKWHLCPYQDTPLCEDPYRNMDWQTWQKW